MRDGLILANSLGRNIVEAESDSMEVINFCCGSTQWWDSAAASYADCLDNANLIGNVKFKHCRREANGVAHGLAKHSFLHKLSCFCINFLHACVYHRKNYRAVALEQYIQTCSSALLQSV